MPHFARAFRSHCSLREMLQRLDEATGVRWIERDNDDWGEYLSSIVHGDTRFRVFATDDGFVLDVASRRVDEASLERLVQHVLRAVDAERTSEAETYDLRAGTMPDEVQRPTIDSFAELYVEYLRARDPRGLPLADALDSRLREHSASMFRAWCEGADVLEEGDHRVFLGPLLPTSASVGDRWFDVCDLLSMQRLERSWFALSSMSWFHVRAVEQLATFVRREGSFRREPAFERFGGEHEMTDARGLTQGEATLVAWWFGKSCPHQLDYQEADRILEPEDMFARRIGEWTSSRASDEIARIVMRPATLDVDANDRLDDDERTPFRMVYDCASKPDDVRFRTAVLAQSGLCTKITPGAPDLVLAEDRTLAGVLDRTRWWRP